MPQPELTLHWQGLLHATIWAAPPLHFAAGNHVALLVPALHKYEVPSPELRTHSTLRFICIAETQAVTFKIGRKDSQLTASPRAIYLHVKHTMALIGHTEAGGIQNQFSSQLQDRLLQEWQGCLELSMQPSQKSSLGLATTRPVCSIQ